jgi:quinol monooxygenase YgiN
MTMEAKNFMYAKCFKIKPYPERFNAVIQFLEWDAQVAAETEQPGTLRFEFYQDPNDLDWIIVYEAYQDKQAFENHKQGKPYKEFVERICPQDLQAEPKDLFDWTYSLGSMNV